MTILVESRVPNSRIQKAEWSVRMFIVFAPTEHAGRVHILAANAVFFLESVTIYQADDGWHIERSF